MKIVLFITSLILLLSFQAPASEAPQVEREPAAIPKNSKAPWKPIPIDGVELSFVYKGEFSRVFSGGVDSQNSYLENLDIKLAIDAEKAMNWTGASFFLYGLGDRGSQPTNSPSFNVGDLQGVSNIETSRSAFKLYEAWYQQKFWDGKASVLLGLHDLNSEFYVTDTSTLFFNSSFGIGNEMAQTGVNGPSIFPTTTTAVRLQIEPTPWFYFQVASFNAQAGDPEASEDSHLRSFGNDGTLLISEAGFVSDIDGNAGKYSVGTWGYDHSFAHLNNSGEHNKSVGSYLLIDHPLSQNQSVFLRYGVASQETNAVHSNLSGGYVIKDPFHLNEQDRMGVAFAQASLGDAYREALSAEGSESEAQETTYELNYRFHVLPGLVLQPDYQYIVNPSGLKASKDAHYGALRVEIYY